MTDHIVSNQIKCLKCGDSVYSMHRHHFWRCSCGAVAVDGGQAYLRRVGTEWEDESILIDEEAMQALTQAAEDAINTRRNPYGVAMAVLRGIRDTDLTLVKVKGSFTKWELPKEEEKEPEEKVDGTYPNW